MDRIVPRVVARFLAHPCTAIVAGAALSYVARASLSGVLLVAAQALLLTGTRRASRRDLAVAFLAAWLASFVAFRGAARELTGGYAAFAVTMGIGALSGLATLALDRHLVARLPPAIAPLVYPAARTPIEVASAMLGPYGAWGSMAALSAGSPLASVVVPVAGMFGLSFVLSWLASAAAAGVVSLARGGARTAALLVAPAAVAATCLFGLGAMRAPAGGATVRVAAVALPDAATGRSPAYARLLEAWRAHGTDAPEALDAEDDRSLDSALRAIGEAADRGATIVYVAETNVHVREDRVATLEAAVGGLARARHLWIGLGVGITLRRAEPNLRNEIVLFDPAGAVAARYLKSHPVGSETHDMVLGTGEVPVLDVQGARIAGIICYDSDFLAFTRSVARQRVDILFAPSNDWSEIAETRAALTRFRALETGATLVRPTSHGVTEIVAPDGRMLAVERYDGARGTVVVADVPARGRATAYAEAGDWAGIGGLAVLVVLVAVPRVRRGGGSTEPAGRFEEA